MFCKRIHQEKKKKKEDSKGASSIDMSSLPSFFILWISFVFKS